MHKFSGIDSSTLNVTYEEAKYRTLTPEQYLKTYETSSLDGYRKDNRKKNDLSKISINV